MDKYRKE